MKDANSYRQWSTFYLNSLSSAATKDVGLRAEGINNLDEDISSVWSKRPFSCVVLTWCGKQLWTSFKRSRYYGGKYTSENENIPTFE